MNQNQQGQQGQGSDKFQLLGQGDSKPGSPEAEPSSRQSGRDSSLQQGSDHTNRSSGEQSR